MSTSAMRNGLYVLISYSSIFLRTEYRGVSRSGVSCRLRAFLSKNVMLSSCAPPGTASQVSNCPIRTPASVRVYRDDPVMTSFLCPGRPFSFASRVHLRACKSIYCKEEAPLQGCGTHWMLGDIQRSSVGQISTSPSACCLLPATSSG